MAVVGSDTYVWFTDKCLGQGATGKVYEARHRKKGDRYAVKVDNPDAKKEYRGATKKELEIVRGLPKHENVVAFVAEETARYSGGERVVVMELCAGGSLFDILRRPEHFFGLPETDLAGVLACLARGLYHLRKFGVCHRDVKPGNILLYISPDDGERVYKLTDFGAATYCRDDDDGFESLWGTEGYMDPSMHSAALTGERGRRFKPRVDLWSTAVTLYQCATGRLPYEPRRGVRKDRRMMQRLMTESAEEGVISRVETENGEIVSSRDLPDTCTARLSRGFRDFFVPLLARLQHRERRMDHEEFHRTAEHFLAKIPVAVFNAQTCEQLTAYVANSDHELLRRELARQTGIPPADQHLVVYGARKLRPTDDLRRRPPLLLLSTGGGGGDRYAPHVPPTPDDSGEDRRWMLEMCGVAYYLEGVARDAHRAQRHLATAVDYTIALLDADCAKNYEAIKNANWAVRNVVGPVWAAVTRGSYVDNRMDRLREDGAELVDSCERLMKRCRDEPAALVDCEGDACLRRRFSTRREACVDIWTWAKKRGGDELSHNEAELYRYDKHRMRKLCRGMNNDFRTRCDVRAREAWIELARYRHHARSYVAKVDACAENINDFGDKIREAVERIRGKTVVFEPLISQRTPAVVEPRREEEWEAGLPSESVKCVVCDRDILVSLAGRVDDEVYACIVCQEMQRQAVNSLGTPD